MLIEEMFRKGNCELNSVRKIYNKEAHEKFAMRLSPSKPSVALLFFANTLDVLDEVLGEAESFRKVYNRSPQDLIFSTDLSIAYHFFKRASGTSLTQARQSAPRIISLDTTRKWRSIIAGIILDKVWCERKSYALFALNFDARVQVILGKGYSIIYFAKDRFYLTLVPEVCIPIYLLDFTFL